MLKLILISSFICFNLLSAATNNDNIFGIEDGSYEDGTKFSTCSEYMKGKKYKTKEYLPIEDINGVYKLKLNDNRIATCDFKALNQIKSQNNWSSLINTYKAGSSYCYNKRLEQNGVNGIIIIHPTNELNSFCTSILTLNSMFRSLTVRLEVLNKENDNSQIEVSYFGDITPKAKILVPNEKYVDVKIELNKDSYLILNTNNSEVDNKSDLVTMKILSYEE